MANQTGGGGTDGRLRVEAIRLAKRYARFTQHLGDNCFDRTGDAKQAMNAGWRAAAHAEGWIYAAVTDRAARPFRALGGVA
jgi:hypothetical protein